MDNTQKKPGEKMILSMLKVIDQYSVEKARNGSQRRLQNPLNSSFELSTQPDNQRNHCRLSMIGQVNVNKDGHFLVGDCKDISASGLFVACYPDENFQINDTVSLIIKLIENEQVFRATAKITRQEKNGYGFEFVTM